MQSVLFAEDCKEEGEKNPIHRGKGSINGWGTKYSELLDD